MAEAHLSNEVFMSELILMFHNARTSGNVRLSMKRYDGRTKPYPKTRRLKGGKKITPDPMPEPEEFQCLIHARLKKKNISTAVSAADVWKFQALFTQFMRSNMDGLKKEKKSKKKGKKATQ